MASDGSAERDLADREPAGCDTVAGASWSQADPSTLVISCRLGKNDFEMLVVNTDGRLIRRLDAGEKRFDDVTISPDGQTVLYWASASGTGDGGSLFTLPLVGTGAPKKITTGAKGLDADPSWSPDGSQIAFRRLVGGVGGNADVYVMNADGSAQRAVAKTKAADIKPVWSPDGKNLARHLQPEVGVRERGQDLGSLVDAGERRRGAEQLQAGGRRDHHPDLDLSLRQSRSRRS